MGKRKGNLDSKTHETLALDTKKQQEFAEKIKSIEADELTPGVVYVGHIPHGFFEDEMKGFFSQFGTIRRLRISRSKKTGTSKGYAFIEFACEEVAKIAAEAMDNYMMFERLLKCQFVPKEKVHRRIWKGASRTFKGIPTAKLAREKHNKKKTVAEQQKQIKHVLKKEVKARKKLKDLGIDYEFPGYAAQATETQKHKRFKTVTAE